MESRIQQMDDRDQPRRSIGQPDHFESEILAVIPREDPVETREGVSIHEPNLHVETDYAFGGFSVRNSRRHSVRWQPDPAFHTQVNYLKQKPLSSKSSSRERA